MKHSLILWPILAVLGPAAVSMAMAAPAWEAPPAQQKQGQFWR
jgi:hypothetical protein